MVEGRGFAITLVFEGVERSSRTSLTHKQKKHKCGRSDWMVIVGSQMDRRSEDHQ